MKKVKTAKLKEKKEAKVAGKSNRGDLFGSKKIVPLEDEEELVDDEPSVAIAEEDDEEIDEDEAFNSEDERKWGAIFPKSNSSSSSSSSSSKTSRKKNRSTIEEEDEDEGVAFEDEDEEEGREDEEEDNGLTLEDMLDASLAADAAKKKNKASTISKQVPEKVTSSSSSSKVSKRQRESHQETMEEEEEFNEEEEEEEGGGGGGFLSDEQRLRILDLLKSSSSSSAGASGATSSVGQGVSKKQMNDKEKKMIMKNKKRLIESGGVGPEGEFTAAHSEAVKAAKGLLRDADSGGVDIGGLVSSLAGTAGFSSLKSRLEKLVGQSLDDSSSSSSAAALIPLKAPPTKEVAEKATRAESYDHVSRLVGNKWTDLVALTRQAPSISFSAEAGLDTRKTQTTASMAASFTPSNEFEVKIAAALAASGMGALPGQSVQGALTSSSSSSKRRRNNNNTSATGDKAVLEAEQSELAALESRLGGDENDDNDDDDEEGGGEFEGDDLAEAPANAAAMKARQKTLQRMRALLFFDEIKKRRINKVKSKTFRRLRKKADARAGADELERLQEEDPEAAKALEDAEARIIAKERASLKHRSSGRGVGGSKWIKRVLARGGGSGNSDAHLHNKADLIAFQQREEALRAKIRGLKEGQEEDEEEEEEEEEEDGGDDDATAADIIARGRASILRIANEDEEGSGKPRKGLFGMRFMSQAVERAKLAARQSADAEAALLTRHENILRGKGGSSGGGGGDATLGGWSLDDDDYDANDALKEEDEAIAEDDDRDGTMFATIGNVASEDAMIEKKFESSLSILRRERAEKKAKADAAASSSSSTTTGRFTFTGRSGHVEGNNDDDEEEDNGMEENNEKEGRTRRSVELKGMSAVRALAAISSNPKLAAKNSTTTLATSTALASSTSASSAAVENPWLASSFSTGLGGRHNASKRAVTAAAAAASKTIKGPNSSSSSVIDVASAISAIQADAAKNKKKTDTPGGPRDDTSAAEAVAEGGKKKMTSRKRVSIDNEDSEGTSALSHEKNKRARVKANEESDEDEDEDEDDNGPVLRRMDQASLVRAAFVDAGADAAADDSIEADKLREEKEKAQDDAVAKKRGKGRAGRGSDNSKTEATPGWGSWTGLGASAIAAASSSKGGVRSGHGGKGQQSPSSSVTPSSSASAILAIKKADIIASEQAKDSETPAQKAARIELQRRRDAGLSGVFISEKRDRKLAHAHQAPSVPHPFPSKEAYEASMRHPLGREWNTMASTAALTKPEWTTKAGLIIQPIKPAKIVRDGKGPEQARKHVSSVSGVGQGARSNKHR